MRDSSADKKRSRDEDWGLSEERQGMARETKIGLFLILILLGAFGFVMYKKLNKNDQMLASIKQAVGLDKKPAEKDPKDPANDDMADADPDKTDNGPPELIPIPQAEPEVGQFTPAKNVRQVAPRSDADDFGDFHEDPFGGGNAGHSHSHKTPQSQNAQRDEFGGDFAAQDPFDASGQQAHHGRKQTQPAFGDFADQQQTARQTPRQQSVSQRQEFVPVDDFSHPFEGDGNASAKTSHDHDGTDEFGFEQTEPTAQNQYQSSRQNSSDDWGQWDNTAQVDNRASGFDASQQAGQSFNADDGWGRQDVHSSQQQTWQAVDERGFNDQPQTFEPTAQQVDDFGNTFEPSHQSSNDAFQQDGRFGANDYRPHDFARQQAPVEPFQPSPVQDAFGEQPSFNSADVPADPNVRVYVVQQGDNYWTISKTQYGTARYFSALEQYNRRRIPDARRMQPGMKVFLPTRQTLEARYAKLVPAASQTAASVATEQTAEAGYVSSTKGTVRFASGGSTPGFFHSPSGEPMYRIGERDTLGGIAEMHLGRSSRWVQIFQMNRDRLNNPHNLPIGTVVRLPADASRVSLLRSGAGSR